LDGYLKRVNPAFEETLGYSNKELLTKSIIEFVHPEDRAATMSELQRLVRGARTAYFENRYLRKDGSQIWLEWKAVPVVEEDLIFAPTRDVTERKWAGEALVQSEERYRAVVEQDADEILLEVRDDGGGFDPESSFPGHLGLKSMRERVARLGGTLRIESAPGEGTRIRAQIPPGT
jgi:PAS domain S-box-containing protein